MRTPAEELAEIRQAGLHRQLRSAHRSPAGTLKTASGMLHDFASNDYLGLAASEQLVEALREAALQFGTGSGASRLISGTSPAHERLEEALAEMKRTPRALTFSSGYAAALGTIPAVVARGDVIILDKLVHACLVDAARLSGATIRVFPHQDLNRLDELLRWARSKVTARSRILILTESVFSMDGDVTDLRAMVRLKQQYEALLLVDEAHAVGVFGPQGRGVAEAQAVVAGIDFQMGTLSKALAVSGGYVASSSDWIELFINRSRSFIFSTAPPPAIAATAQFAIELVRGEEGERLRGELWARVHCFQALLAGHCLGSSPICPILVGSSQRAVALSEHLRALGFWTPAIRFPTVPRKKERIRVTIHAAQSQDSVRELATEIVSWLTKE